MPHTLPLPIPIPLHSLTREERVDIARRALMGHLLPVRERYYKYMPLIHYFRIMRASDLFGPQAGRTPLLVFQEEFAGILLRATGTLLFWGNGKRGESGDKP